jgi:hypothetical protein
LSRARLTPSETILDARSGAGTRDRCRQTGRLRGSVGLHEGLGPMKGSSGDSALPSLQYSSLECISSALHLSLPDTGAPALTILLTSKRSLPSLAPPSPSYILTALQTSRTQVAPSDFRNKAHSITTDQYQYHPPSAVAYTSHPIPLSPSHISTTAPRTQQYDEAQAFRQ